MSDFTIGVPKSFCEVLGQRVTIFHSGRGRSTGPSDKRPESRSGASLVLKLHEQGVGIGLAYIFAGVRQWR